MDFLAEGTNKQAWENLVTLVGSFKTSFASWRESKAPDPKEEPQEEGDAGMDVETLAGKIDLDAVAAGKQTVQEAKRLLGE
eukprot:5792930-Prorocentrum_lima.AAC.1